MKNKEQIDFVFESFMLKKTPRSGYQFLGNSSETVAEHSFGVLVLVYLLSKLNSQANLEEMLKMALFHDLAEAKTGDLNYVNKRYVKADETKALKETVENLSFGEEILELNKKRNLNISLEANLVKDADQLDFIVELRKEEVNGNTQAKDWLFYATKRLITKEAKELCAEIIKADPNKWWFKQKEAYWVLKD